VLGQAPRPMTRKTVPIPPVPGHSLHILRWGTYDTSKPRTRILSEGLRVMGARLRECHASVWEGIEDKSQVRGLLRKLRLLLRWLTRYPGLTWGLLRAPRPDVVLVGYPGVLDVIVAAPVARLRGLPLAWDMFMSVYDTLVLDRQLIHPASLRARLLRGLESFAIRRADAVFLDTEAHARRIESLYGLSAGSCGAVWVGAEVEQFRLPESAAPAARASGPLKVLFYGQFIPLHGVDTIVAAARLMSDDDVDWTLIGRGQESDAVRRMLRETPLPKLRWIEWVDYADLKHWIAGADVCLGIFGTSEKAASVIPNKVFHVVAAGRPLVTRDSPAVRELLEPDPPCVYLVRAGDPRALVDAVREHARRTTHAVPDRCHAALAARIAAPAIGRQFMESVAHRLDASRG
jgi:glycosyltransferase involved in cell wall biosynthesis